MTPRTIAETISIDTQVFVATGYGFTSKIFQALKAHFVTGRLGLVMTDITVREVYRRIRQSVTEELVAQRSFINQSRVLFNSSLPDVKSTLAKLDPDVVSKNLCDQVDAFLQEAKAKIIETKGLIADDVLNKYFRGDPPFGTTENKRHEFPDAFAIQALGDWAEAKDLQMFVVSGDKLFQEACSECPHLLPKATLIEVLDHVASDDAQLAEFVRTETMKHVAAIGAEARKEFEDRYYWVEDQDGDAQVEVTKLVPNQDPEIIEISKDEAVIQMAFKATYLAHLSYNDLATASYDSEDGALIYAERREETVEREQELLVEVQVAHEQLDLNTFEIVDVSLTSPSDSFGIQTQEDADWPYK